MNDEYKRVYEQFKIDTANHKMEVLLDKGLHRHLKFSKNGSSVYRFDLVTWPGYLAVSGDMGEWVFSRLPDMFEFFRADAGFINASYWAAKCQAADTRGSGLKSFSSDTAREQVAARVRELYEDSNPSLIDEALQEAATAIYYHDGEIRFYDSCSNFEGPEGLRPFEDFEAIPDPMEWSFHYLWICHAIVAGIRQFDEANAKQGAA